MYGTSPTVPGILEGDPVTDGKVTDSDIVRDHFRRQEKAREVLRQADASSRLKEAIKARIQPYNDKVYEIGDKIMFLNKDDDWDGPGTVKAIESKTVWIMHNGQLNKVASCRMRPWFEEDDASEEDTDEDGMEDSDEVSALGETERNIESNKEVEVV